jgi:hypothetical protein
LISPETRGDKNNPVFWLVIGLVNVTVAADTLSTTPRLPELLGLGLDGSVPLEEALRKLIASLVSAARLSDNA